MSTSLREFIEIMLKEVGAEFSRTNLREITNRGQNEILARDCQVMRVRPDPFITTVDSTYSYVASSSIYDSSTGAKGALVGDVRLVKEIYSFDSSVGIFDYQTLDPTSDKPNQFLSQPSVERVSTRIDCIQSVKPDSSDCVIKWWEGNNPGATTVTWRCVCYKWPTQLTSESIALSIPEDFIDTLLYHAVMRRIRRREYTTEGESFQTYEYYLKEFRDRYNRSPTQELNVCFPRDF